MDSDVNASRVEEEDEMKKIDGTLIYVEVDREFFNEDNYEIQESNNIIYMVEDHLDLIKGMFLILIYA